MEHERPSDIQFHKVQLDTVLTFRNRIMETDDFSHEGLYQFVLQHDAAILEQMEFMDSGPRHRAHNRLSQRPSVYVARLAINASNVIGSLPLDHYVKQFSNPGRIDKEHRPYWDALEKTDYDIYAGIVRAHSAFDGLWLGLQEPRRRK